MARKASSVSSPLSVIDAFAQHRPDAVELAIYASPAVRVEPELLRALRLGLLPAAGAQAEADLWFSALVRARGLDGIALRDDVLQVLRTQLHERWRDRLERTRAQRAWAIIESMHANASPALALEERVAWLIISDAGRGRVERELYRALRAIEGGDRPNLIRWAANAWKRLPPGARRTSAGWLLGQVSGAAKRGPVRILAAPEGVEQVNLALLVGSDARSALGVRRAGAVLELGAVGGPGAAAIDVLDTEPRLVGVLPEKPRGEPPKAVPVPSGTVVRLNVGEGIVRLVNALQEVYELPPATVTTDYAELELRLRWNPKQDAFDVFLRFTAADTDDQIVYSEVPFTIDLRGLARLVNDVPAYGEALSEMVFQSEEVAQFYARAIAATKSMPVRLRIHLDGPSQFHSVRWELLRDPVNGRAIATSNNLLFSRYISGPDWRPIPIHAAHDPSAIVVIAAPSNLDDYAPGGRRLPPIDVDGEMARAQEALFDYFLLTLAGPGNATLPNILESLERPADGFDILYLVAHGALTDDVPRLFLEQPDGTAHPVDGRSLTERIDELERKPSLVMLLSGQSAAPGGEFARRDDGALAGLGPRLAGAGVAAVVGMQANITMATAGHFAAVFFQELRKDWIVDRAMAVARNAVRDRPDWWVPVLFSRLRSGQLYYQPTRVRQRGPAAHAKDPDTPATRADPAAKPRMTLLELARQAQENLQDVWEPLQNALRAMDQVERRGALPTGMRDWDDADQEAGHLRVAASMTDPAAQLESYLAQVVSVFEDAEHNVAELVIPKLAQPAAWLAPIIAMVSELEDLSRQLLNRVTNARDDLRARIVINDDYRTPYENLHRAHELIEHASSIAFSLKARLGRLHADQATEKAHDPWIIQDATLSEESVTVEPGVWRVPLLREVAERTPILAGEENVRDYLTLPPQHTRPDDAFAVKVTGDSMAGDGVFDGDYVVVVPDPEPKDGEMVAVSVEGHGEPAVKRLWREGTSVRLESSNPAYPPIIVEQDAELIIQGKVIGVVKPGIK
jgi:SOS-response transcriptional repressor LexA